MKHDPISPDSDDHDPVGAPSPAAAALPGKSPAAGDLLFSELPLAVLDRPEIAPPGTAGGEGETAALPGTGAGGSIALVLQKRIEHVALGYDAAHDAKLPPTHLVDQAAKYFADAHDLIRRGADPAAIRLKLVNGTALGLAALDRHLSQGEKTDEAF